MSKLLSDEGLRKEIANILLLDRQAMEPYVSVVDDLINLINTQKRLYAESVIGEDEPERVVVASYGQTRAVAGAATRNTLRAEQRARISR